MMKSFFESSLFTALYPLLLFLSVAGGYVLARNRYFKKKRSWKPSGTENAIIGFYGLLLSFTLLSSGNTHKERMTLIHQHADALRDIYTESRLLNDSSKQLVRASVAAILSSKIQSGDSRRDNRIDSLYDNLFDTIGKMTDKKSITESSGRFYRDKIYTAVALDNRLWFSKSERTPITIMILLIAGSFLIGILIGFTNGFNEEHHFLIPFIFLMLTSLTIIAIRDLDNPTKGIIRPSANDYQNMLKAM